MELAAILGFLSIILLISAGALQIRMLQFSGRKRHVMVITCITLLVAIHQGFVCWIVLTGDVSQPVFLSAPGFLLSLVVAGGSWMVLPSLRTRNEAMEGLHESTESYRRLFNNAQVGMVCAAAPGGEIIECNERFAHMFGYEDSGECIREMNLADQYVEPETWDTIVKSISFGSPGVQQEAELRKRDGNIIWTRSYGHYLPDISVIEGVMVDVTEEKKASQGLFESTRRYQRLYNNALVGMVLARPSDGTVVECNERFAQMHGYDSRDECVDELVLIDQYVDREFYDRFLEKLYAQRQVQNYEAEFYRRDGGVFWARCTTGLLYEEGLVESVVTDITEEKRAEEAHVLLSTAIEQAGEVVVITDTNGIVEYVNPAFEHVTGYRSEEILGKNPSVLKSGRHDDEFYDELWAAIVGGNVWSGHFTNKKKDGTLYEEEATISPIRDHSGLIVNFVAVKRDVTIEMQQRQTHRLEAIGRLAGGVAHDFNNLLTGMMGNVGLLQMDLDPDSPLQNYANEIAQTATRAARLTKQLLTFSKRAVMTPQVLNLNKLIADIEELLRRTIGNNVELSSIPGGNLWNVEVDQTQIEQIIINLSVNARDAMESGGTLIIETQNVYLNERMAPRIPDVRDGRYVMLVTSDTGCGMDEATLQSIFEPFFTTKGDQGTGLGLATVYGIVNQSNGYILCDSAPGEGTSFRIYLPAVDDDVDDDDSLTDRDIDLGGREGILFIEDDEQVLQASTHLLRRHGFTVFTAENGKRAIELCEDHSDDIDLVITDIQLPDMNGNEISARITEMHPDTRIIYTSGYSSNVFEGDEGEMASEADFLQKPYQVTDLLKKIRAALEK
jgi:two-component system, cell cycle sensor histidine kinase and response regulator CckA